MESGSVVRVARVSRHVRAYVLVANEGRLKASDVLLR